MGNRGYYYQNQKVVTTTGGFRRRTHFVATGANAIAERESAIVTVHKSESTSSTSYTDLKTTGPSVTITTGTSALVFFSCEMQNNTTNSAAMASVAVSGATTVAASDNWRILANGVTAANVTALCGFHHFTGLTAGLNTFTMKYAASANTATFNYRQLSVIAL